MKFEKKLLEARLIKRYKRFLADVELENGNIVTVHTANTGAMTGCCTPGSRVWLSQSDNPKRKHPLSWELIEVKPGVIAGINTALPNRLVQEAIEQDKISELSGYEKIRCEVVYGEENSRIDLLLEAEGRAACYVEIKNVTLVENDSAFFPDAVSKRGSKHLRELIEMHKRGHRSVIFYCVQRKDAKRVCPADSIDPEYARTLRLAIRSGVEALAYRAQVSSSEVFLQTSLPVIA
jgi:sugar fermentation stimulation protein A